MIYSGPLLTVLMQASKLQLALDMRHLDKFFIMWIYT